MVNKQLLREVMHQQLVEQGYDNSEAKHIVDLELNNVIFNMIKLISNTVQRYNKENK